MTLGRVRWALGAAVTAALSVLATAPAEAHERGAPDAAPPNLLAAHAPEDMGALQTHTVSPQRGSPPAAPAAPVAPAAQIAPNCDNPNALGVSRIARLDPRGGPRFGRVGGEATPFLAPGEVILTYDDGPNPRGTPDVLRALADECVLATFFAVGQMARWHPEILRATAAAGHTIAGHTERHPMPVYRAGQAAARAEIREGFVSLERVLGRPAAAVFRFPGLAESDATIRWLASHDIASLGVDVLSGDTRSGSTPQQVVARIMSQLRRQGRGVILLHDPLRRTARATPLLLAALRAEGYRIVHLEVAGPGAGRARFDGPTAPSTAAQPQEVVYRRPPARQITPPLLGALY